MTASSHGSIPRGLTLYTFSPSDPGEGDFDYFHSSDDEAARYAEENNCVRAFNVMSGRTIYERDETQ